ncbi:phosphoglycolate phosphatase [Achromatium sp. WMS1]|nr:phosphoglycolate phosphatase [Achromatium sp. WMS1]
MQRPKLALIDLDGTLIDSVPDLTYCIDKTMEHMQRPICGETKVRNWVGNGIERLVCRALTNEMHTNPSPADLAKALPIFLDLYAVYNGERSVLYPTVKEGLDGLQAYGCNLACITNKAQRFVRPLLSKLGIDHHFDLVIAGDTLPQKKPDPAPLLHAVSYFGMTLNNVLMIGDSINDVRAARAAGIPIVCVSYGYNHGQDIRRAQPDKVIDSFASLLEFLPSLL